MRHPRNRPCAEEAFFAPRVQFDLEQSAGDKLRAAARSVWSRAARERLRALLRARGTPDVAHLNAFIFQLTPSVLKPLIERGVPIVQTCHEYGHICPNQHLYNFRSHRVCERCLRDGPLAPLWTGCIKGSFAASAAGCAAALGDRLVGHSRRLIRRFFTPGAYMRRKYIQGGMPPKRVFHVPHPLHPDWIAPGDGPGDFMLFLGRLAPYKGIMTFLAAARHLPDVPCRIVGDGPLEEAVRARLADPAMQHVTLSGWLEGDELKTAIRAARAAVVPSEWYEPFGYVILEAMLAARPVIATNIAGPAELVRPGEDGLLFPLGNATRLAREMKLLWSEPDRAMALGESGRRKVLERNDPERHYRRMMSHFRDVMS